jgi:hypothetical protein
MSDTITPRLRIKAQPEVAVRAKAVPLPKVRLRIMPSLLPMQIELQNTGTMVQWRYLGEAWQDLIAIDDINTSITIGTVTTLPAGSPATVTNVGTPQDPVFDFGIPQGIQGIQGNAATIAVGTVSTVDPGDPAAVTNVGTPNDAVFDFDIPQGEAATVAVGTVTTVGPLAPATVTNVGTPGAAVLNFEIPKGDDGLVVSVVAGANITVDNTDPANPIVAAAGNVSGPAGAVDNRVALFDGTSGKLIKDSGVVLGNSASRNVGTGAGTVAAGDDSRIAGSIQSSVLTTQGDILVRNATLPARLAKGTQYQVLQAGATDPLYGALNLAQAAAVTGVLPAANHPDATTSAKGISEFATAAEYRTGTDTARSLVVDQVWAAAVLGVLTDGANIAVDFAAGFNFGGSSNAVLGLGGDRSLSAPSNLKNGQTGVLWFGAVTSTRILTLNAAWLLLDGVEVGPYSITTAQELGIAYVIRASRTYVTAIMRRAA